MFQGKTWIKMPKLTTFLILHAFVSIIETFWRNNSQSIIDVVERLCLCFFDNKWCENLIEIYLSILAFWIWRFPIAANADPPLTSEEDMANLTRVVEDFLAHTGPLWSIFKVTIFKNVWKNNLPPLIGEWFAFNIPGLNHFQSGAK